MQDLSSLPDAEVAYRLKTSGLYLRVGNFIMHVRSEIAGVWQALSLLYKDYPASFDEEFADFHVRVTKPKNLRRWLRQQAVFMCDGVSAFKPLPLAQAYPMLEWGMNWCVSGHAHGYLMIHAAVIERNGTAVILPAPPGSGKSTLCAGLISRGWRLLSDEIALVRLDDGRILPHPRPVSLKNASIDVIRAFAPDGVMSPLVRDTVKGTVCHLRPPVDSVRRAGESAIPAFIVFPRYEASSASLLAPVPRGKALIRVADNAFNYGILGDRGFLALADLIERSSCYDFTYSSLEDAIKVFANLASLEPGHAS